MKHLAWGAGLALMGAALALAAAPPDNPPKTDNSPAVSDADFARMATERSWPKSISGGWPPSRRAAPT